MGKEAKIKQETLLQAADDKRSLAKAEEDKVSAQASEIRIDKLVVSNKATSEVVDAKAEQTVKTDVAAKKELTKAKTAKTTEVLKDQGSDKTCDNCQQAEAELAAKDKEISKDKKKLLNAKEDSKMPSNPKVKKLQQRRLRQNR